MNERIKQLIAQAGGIGHDDDGNELTPALVGQGLEKFAELIVKECALVVHKKTGPKSALNVLEHFGVEE